jgi:hypothetical protein
MSPSSARASTLGTFTSPRVIGTILVSGSGLPSTARFTVSCTTVPGSPRIRSTASPAVSGLVGFWSISTMSSPLFMPARSAGLSGKTSTAISLPSSRPMRVPMPLSLPEKRIWKSSELRRPETTVE